MEYFQLIKELEQMAASEEYIAFQGKILCTDKRILGVRTPDLRAFIRRHKGEYFSFKAFPADVYEVSFIKICLAGYLTYDELIAELPYLVSIMDCWALTDSFSSPAIKDNRAEFKRYIDKYIHSDGVFARRIALIILLKYYLDDDIPYALECVKECDKSPYYVSMAAAWLIAEAVIRNYAVGTEFLREGVLDPATQNRAVQKCVDSFRLTSKQKEEIKLYKKR